MRFSASTKSLTSQSISKMPILSRACSPSSLSGGSISSLSQSTGKKRAPPTSQNNTRHQFRTKNKTASKASKRKTDYKRVNDDVDDDDNTDDDDDKDYNKDDDEFS